MGQSPPRGGSSAGEGNALAEVDDFEPIVNGWEKVHWSSEEDLGST